MIVKEQKPIELKNECGAIFDEKELIRAMIWYGEKPICRVKRVFLSGKYPAVSIHEKKIHIHRLLMLYWTSNKIPKGFVVHHINGDKLDARMDNLSLFPASTHSSGHNKGKTFSKEYRAKLSEANRKRRGTRYRLRKPEITKEQVYTWRSNGMSFNEISKMTGLDWGCVKQRYIDFIHDNPELLEETK